MENHNDIAVDGKDEQFGNKILLENNASLASENNLLQEIASVEVEPNEANGKTEDSIITVKKNVYMCSKCNFSTRKRKKFRKHWAIHEDSKFKCDICKKQFNKLVILRRHLATHGDRKHHTCDLCGRTYLHSISLKYHKLSHLKHNPILGERTKKIQRNKADAGKPKVLLCDLCGMTFKQALSLKTHISRHEEAVERRKFLKDLAHRSDFEYEIYLNKRRPGPKRKNPSITERKKFKCSECPYAAIRSRDVMIHLRTHTGEKPFPCDICGKRFSKQNVVEKHKLTHSTKVKKHRTDTKSCDEKNKNNGNPMERNCFDDNNVKLAHTARVNKNVYSGDNYDEITIKDEFHSKYPYFDSSYSNVNREMVNGIHKDINYIPNGKGFSANDDLLQTENFKSKNLRVKDISTLTESNNCSFIQNYREYNDGLHKNSEGSEIDSGISNHNDENAVRRVPHVIRIDGNDPIRVKKDSQKVVKEKTKRIKTEKKKHKCDQCPYETFLSRDLRVHMRKHSGERPFPCPICGKRFSKESVVKRHQTVHTGLKPYCCNYCFKSFSQLSNLNTHKITHFDVTTGLLKDTVKKDKQQDLEETTKQSDLVQNTDIKDSEQIIDIKNSVQNADLKDYVQNTDIKDLDKNIDSVDTEMKTNVNLSILSNIDSGCDSIRKKRKQKKPHQEIETVNVDHIDVKDEPEFKIKTEFCSSDDECLKDVKEYLLQANCVNVESEFDDAWQNDNQNSDEAKNEFKENHVNIDVDNTNVGKDDYDALERKRRKKLKKKKKKKKPKLENKDLDGHNLYNGNPVLQTINEGDKILFKCEECHYSVVNKRDLIVHMRSHSGEKLFTCDICNKNFSKQSVVNRHKLIHFGIRPYTCHLCGLTFTQSNSLKKHVEVKHGVEEKGLPFQCDQCPATFAQEKSLKTHKHSHLRKKHNEFTCHICGKIFPHECRLKSHLLLHEDRQFNCAICSKKFLRKYDLKYHQLIHSQEKQCVCDVCGGTFSTPSTLKSHMRIHSKAESKPSNDESLDDSIGDKDATPFQCLLCDKRFSQASGLRKHQVAHSNVKPHQCNVCSKRFKIIGHLYKHYNTTKHGSVDFDKFIDNT